MAEFWADASEQIKADADLVLDRIIVTEADDLISKLKWSLSYSRRKMIENGEAPHPQIMQDVIEGCLRGELAERISKVAPIADCPTVYATTDERQLTLATFKDISGKKTKSEVLIHYIKKSLFKKTPKYILNEAEDMSMSIRERRKKAGEQIVELTDWYWQTGGANGGGDMFDSSGMPDGVLLDKDFEIVGPCEVKAYTPDQIRRFVGELLALQKKNGAISDPRISILHHIGKFHTEMRIGVDLEKEIEFIDFIRNLGFGLPKLYERMPILLRFPSDAAVYYLQKYGKVIRSMGYPYVVIQTLPVSSEQLNQKAIKLLKLNIDKIKGSNGYMFKQSEIRSMENLII